MSVSAIGLMLIGFVDGVIKQRVTTPLYVIVIELNGSDEVYRLVFREETGPVTEHCRMAAVTIQESAETDRKSVV